MAADYQLSVSAVSNTSLSSDELHNIGQVSEETSVFNVDRHCKILDGSSGSGGSMVAALPLDTVAVRLRPSSLQRACPHRVTIPAGSYCHPDCDKCPSWGAKECIFSRRQTSLAYCDLCPEYGKPGCIFGTPVKEKNFNPQIKANCRSSAYFSLFLLLTVTVPLHFCYFF